MESLPSANEVSARKRDWSEMEKSGVSFFFLIVYGFLAKFCESQSNCVLDPTVFCARSVVAVVLHRIVGIHQLHYLILAVDDKVVDDEECDHDMTDAEYAEYHRQFSESDGFGFVKVPPNCFAFGLLTMLSQNEIVFREHSPYAALAIDYYNTVKGTNYELKGLERVNTISESIDEFYITFQATEKDAIDVDIATAAKTFQAKVLVDDFGYISGSDKPEIFIDFCRLKPSNGEGGSSNGCESRSGTVFESSMQVKESYGFDDVCVPNHMASGAEFATRRYVPCAKLAIMLYNLVNREKWEFEGIERVKGKSTEYDEFVITFQATDNNAIDAATTTETFEAKVILDYFRCLPTVVNDRHFSHKPRILLDYCMLKSIANEGHTYNLSSSGAPERFSGFRKTPDPSV